MNRFEATYDRVLKTVFSAANPIKKTLIRTQCQVHKFINIHALNILRNDEYFSEYYFLSNYIDKINEGAVWADQDFKSSNHFYNPYKKRGMFGRRSAMDLAIEYYYDALGLWKSGELNDSIFYLGAALHILQDMTVPQHANIRLLDNHRQYENYIKRTYQYMEDFQVNKGAYILNSIEDYIRFNTRVAIRIYKKFKYLPHVEDRFYRIARCGLPLAQKTTAGAMVLFYKDMLLKRTSDK